ncbi:hypothetical protein L1049_000561 [Liquidambar formosana]|uniref:Uncharacterized protein n=1 Tax=Liquidambar formosana TaxID=63359 RepID=A0AAP0R317_LIQFO
MCLNIAPDHGVIHEGVAMKLVLKNGTSVGEESGIVGDRRGGKNGSDCEWIFGIQRFFLKKGDFQMLKKAFGILGALGLDLE